MMTSPFLRALPSSPHVETAALALGIDLGFGDSSSTLSTIPADQDTWNKAIADLRYIKLMFAGDRRKHGALRPRPAREMISHRLDSLYEGTAYEGAA